jgi:NADH-quinone oxidoreductase subunit J
VGAITVLILFALMLTAQRLMREPKNAIWWRVISFVACFALCAVLVVGVAWWPGWPEDPAAVSPTPMAEYQKSGYLNQLAHGLLGTYLLPFEIASVLLLVALVGAIVLAKEERD